VRLPDPQRSYAILIGTCTYASTELPNLPAVRNNLEGLAAVLTSPELGGIPVDRCVVIPNPIDVRTVYRTLRQYASRAEDTLFFYFAGHGRVGSRNELFLSLADTDPDELRVSAMAFDLVRDILADCPAVNRVVILDCCFSGRAIQGMSGGTEAAIDQIGIEGTYVLASAPANAVALAPLGATYTAFTGELLNILRHGVPGGPEFLTFNEIYRRLLQVTTTRGLPIPRQRGTGTADLLALTRNVAADPSYIAPTVPTWPLPPSPVKPWMSVPVVSTSRVLKLMPIVAWLALLGGLSYGLVQTLDRIWWTIEHHAPVIFSGDIGSGIPIQMIVAPIVTTLVGIVIWVVARRKDTRAWAGVGLLLGYTIVDAVSIPSTLAYPLYVESSLGSDVAFFGRILFDGTAVVAGIAVARMRSVVRLGRPVLPGVGTLVIACALIGPASNSVAISVAGLWNIDGPYVFVIISIGILGVVLPVLGVLVRPMPLAVGLTAGWLAFVIPSELVLVGFWNLYPAAERTFVIISTVADLALLVLVLVMFSRARADSREHSGRRPRQPEAETV
jgi:hypothetical protein